MRQLHNVAAAELKAICKSYGGIAALDRVDNVRRSVDLPYHSRIPNPESRIPNPGS